MIKYTGNSSKLALVYKEYDPDAIYLCSLLNQTILLDGTKPYFLDTNGITKIYISEYVISLQEELEELEFSEIKYANIPIIKVMYKAKEIWSLIKSCFGTGFWKKNELWKRTDYWK